MMQSKKNSRESHMKRGVDGVKFLNCTGRALRHVTINYIKDFAFSSHGSLREVHLSRGSGA